jgi:hypothetical protein
MAIWISSKGSILLNRRFLTLVGKSISWIYPFTLLYCAKAPTSKVDIFGDANLVAEVL